MIRGGAGAGGGGGVHAVAAAQAAADVWTLPEHKVMKHDVSNENTLTRRRLSRHTSSCCIMGEQESERALVPGHVGRGRRARRAHSVASPHYQSEGKHTRSDNFNTATQAGFQPAAMLTKKKTLFLAVSAEMEKPLFPPTWPGSPRPLWSCAHTFKHITYPASSQLSLEDLKKRTKRSWNCDFIFFSIPCVFRAPDPMKKKKKKKSIKTLRLETGDRQQAETNQPLLITHSLTPGAFRLFALLSLVWIRTYSTVD